jgi:glycosyltransferase involved in cell wall biosynthesis
MEDEFVAAGLPPEKVRLIPNGVDTKFFSPEGTGPSKRRGLVFAGRFDRQKGLPSLIEALALLSPRRPELTLRLFGGGPEEESLRSLAEDLGVAKKVIFKGIRESVDVKKALGEAAAAVQPSIAEGLSCSLLEAMSMECPVVTTDIPANRQLIAHGKTGLLVPPGEVQPLAAAIDGLLDDPEEAMRMGREARRKVEEEYSVEVMATRYADLFRRVTAEAV